MTHQFSQVPKAEIPRSSFDRSHGLKTSCDAGLLVPIFVDEVLPGDTLSLRASLFGRLATPLKPVMDNLFMETFFFFIPNRLVWENWQKFCGQQDNPGDTTDYVIPIMTYADGTVTGTGTVSDYFGLPLGYVPDETQVSALPFRSYQLVYNEWFRDQNLQDSLIMPNGIGDGPDVFGGLYGTVTPVRRGKRHDYFTSCLPWPQKGDPVTVDLGGNAPIMTTASADGADIYVGEGDEYTTATGLVSHATTRELQYEVAQGGEPSSAVNLFADLANATGFTINDLRQSFAIQRLLERDARGGTRYTEVVRSHFGVTSPDARLQRPEFLGGGSSMVSINPVAQTAADDIGSEQTPLGNLSAFGTVSGTNHGFTKSFTEHGHILGLVNFRANLTYQQGMPRMWSRRTRFDFFWPALSHLGEMAVLNQEIYYQGTADDQSVFGYQEAWADYRYKPSQITGLFRSTATESLDIWHLSQEFADLPVLGPTFIEDNPPIDRVIAVPDEPHFLLDCFFKYRCARPMPLYGVPGLIDHF